MNLGKKLGMVVPVAAIFLSVDLYTKHVASTLIDPYKPIEVLPFFNLVNVKNVGAAFGMFQGLGNEFFVGVSIVAIGLVVTLILKERGRMALFSLSLILAGALGNLTDRLALGYVRDFLDFSLGSYHWPAFNVADSALTVGLALMLIDAAFAIRASRKRS